MRGESLSERPTLPERPTHLLESDFKALGQPPARCVINRRVLGGVRPGGLPTNVGLAVTSPKGGAQAIPPDLTRIHGGVYRLVTPVHGVMYRLVKVLRQTAAGRRNGRVLYLHNTSEGVRREQCILD